MPRRTARAPLAAARPAAYRRAVQIRPALASDVPALLDMMEDFNRIEQIPWQRAAGEAPLRTLLAAPDLGLVGLCERDGSPAGYFIITWGFDLEWGGRDAFLTELYLRPELRGLGLGGPALTAALALARERGARAIHLMVRTDNQPALKLYRRAGFLAPPRVLLTRPLT